MSHRDEVKIRSDCRACRGTNLDLVIDFGRMPLAGGFLSPERVGEDVSYPLTLVRCRTCTLMQVPEVVDPEVIFREYSYASSTTATLSTHFEEMADYLISLPSANEGVVVEFGCNDGVLLRPLQRRGAVVVGVDPSDVASKASRDQGWPLLNTYFGTVAAEEIISRFGHARIVTANNVFAHSDDLDSLMAGVDAVLEPEGFFVFEVHYQGALIDSVQFDTVYHEHLCYYSATSLTHLLGRFGFRIVDLLFVPTHSGSVRVVAARVQFSHVPSPDVDATLKAESLWNIDQFVERVAVRRESVRQIVQDLKKAGKSIVAYGAAGRATVMLNYCNLGPDLIDYVVDASPLRSGKLVPGVLVPIVSPDVFRATPPHYALLTAWNYEAEVVRNEQQFLKAGGRLIVPLPEVRLVGST